MEIRGIDLAVKAVVVDIKALKGRERSVTERKKEFGCSAAQ